MFRRCSWRLLLGIPLAACEAGSSDSNAKALAGSAVDAGSIDSGPASEEPCANPLEILDCNFSSGYEINTYAPGSLPELYLIGHYTVNASLSPELEEAIVHVASGGPMILALTAYERTHWTITADDPAALEGVVLVGHFIQTATAPAGVPVESHSFEAGEHDLVSECGYSWPYDGQGCDTGYLIQYVVEPLAGRKLTAFAGCYEASDFRVNGCDCPELSCAAPEALVAECGGPGGVSVTDAAIATWLSQATAAGGCGEVTMAHDAPELFASSCAEAPEPTIVTFTATDTSGQTATCTSSVSVLDTTPPAVALEQTATCLWPPSHAMAGVASVDVSDVCDPDAAATGVAASSDERTSTESGAGGPNKCPDARVVDGVIELRAERAGPSGKDNGRVYGSVRVSASDSCGNATEAALPVGAAPGCPGVVCVPHDHGSADTCPAVDDGQVDATACN